MARERVQFHPGEVFLNVNAISRCRAERKRDSHSHVFAGASISRSVFPRYERDEYLDLYIQGDGRKGVALVWIGLDYSLVGNLKLFNGGTIQLQSYKILKFPGFKILQFSNFLILNFSVSQILRFSNFPILKSIDSPLLKFSIFLTFTYSDI